MNRITTAESSVPHKLKSAQPTTEVYQGKLVQSEVGEYVQSMFMPMHYEQNYAYPLIVWLHGDEDDERQLHRIMPYLSMRNYVAAAPRGLASAELETGYGWSQTDRCIEFADQAIAHTVDRAKARMNINPQRIMLAGLGSGATMALRIALRQPHRFAGVVAIGGGLPTRDTPFSALNRSRRLPLLICQGRTSIDYSDDRLCEDLRLLHVGGFSVTLRQYPCGDDLVDLMLRDTNIWVMDRVTGKS